VASLTGSSGAPAPDAAIFDLDGVLIDSEQVWADVRERFTRAQGGRWHDGATREMMGMSSTEWSRYIATELGVPMPAEQISHAVVERVAEVYRHSLPLLPGAVEAVRRIGAIWPLGLASSANRSLIDLVLELAGLASQFRVTISSEEVLRGKPAPDVYLEAAARLGVAPANAVAVEDSTNGLFAARRAGLGVIAIPNRSFPPAQEALDAADRILSSLDELDREAVEAAARSCRRRKHAPAAPTGS
jgi:HAD superfamily hydrolase (TIGR01509 family)